MRAFVFGSFARGENGPDSDIDILVKFDPEAKVSLFDHVSMTYDLEEILGMEVDLVHGYYEVDPDEVWNVIGKDLQPLKEQLVSYLKEF